jgi:hypothetical protein
MCAESVAQAGEGFAQLAEIVNLAVEDDRDAPGFVPHRLRSAGEIDDGEAPHPQVHGGLFEAAFVVRPAVAQRRQHAPQRFTGLDAGLDSNNAANAAHSGSKG